MRFAKMHGIGNDYVYVDGWDHEVADPAALARAVSDRSFGVGSDGLILILPDDEADCRLEVELYPVEDLVVFRDQNNELWSDFDSLMETLQSTVQPDTWTEVGGEGSSASVSLTNTQLLVVSQTQETHRKIAQLLKRIRTLNKRLSGDGRPPLKERPIGGMGMGGMGMGGMGMGGYGMGGMGMGGYGMGGSGGYGNYGNYGNYGGNQRNNRSYNNRRPGRW